MSIVGHHNRRSKEFVFPLSINSYGNFGTNLTAFDSVKIPGNKMLSVPYQDANIYEFDANTNTLITRSVLNTNLHYGGILTPQNKVIFINAATGQDVFSSYDLSDNSITTFTNPTNVSGFLGACLHSDGFVYMFSSGNIGKGMWRIDPSDNTFSEILPNFVAQGSSNAGLISAFDGKLYALPLSNGNLLEYDPVSNSITGTYTINNAANAAYYGGQLLPNGNILLTPRNANSVAIFDVTNKTFTYYPLPNATDNEHLRATLLKSGRVIMFPGGAANYTIFDSTDNTLFRSKFDDPPLNFKHIGSTIDDNGRAIAFPANSTVLLTAEDNLTNTVIGTDYILPTDLSNLATSNYNKYYNNY